MEHDIEIVNRLALPLDPKNVAKHPHTKMDYLEGYHVIDEANAVFGELNWEMRIISPPTFIQIGEKGLYHCIVEITVAYLDDDLGSATTVRRQDTGSCPLPKENVEGHDMAIKGAVTDAMKRCFRTFGQRFGNVLYDKAAPWKNNKPGTSGGAASGKTPEQSVAKLQKAKRAIETDTLEEDLKFLEGVIDGTEPIKYERTNWPKVADTEGKDKEVLKKEMRAAYAVSEFVIDAAGNLEDLVDCYKNNYGEMANTFTPGWMEHIDERFSVRAYLFIAQELNSATDMSSLKRAWKLVTKAKDLLNEQHLEELTVLKDERKGMQS